MDASTIPRAEWPTGARVHVGLIFPSPVPPRLVREFYEIVPPGVDLSTVSLTVTNLGDEAIREAGRGVEAACKQLAQYDVDLIYFLGAPPIVLQGPGFHRVLDDRMSQAAGLPAICDISGVLAAMRALDVKRVALATPFEPVINERMRVYLASEGFEMTGNEYLNMRRNADIRRLPIRAEYDLARKAVEASQPRADAIYTACGSWGSVHHLAQLERDLGVKAVSWFSAFVWSTLRHGMIGGIDARFGRLLASL